MSSKKLSRRRVASGLAVAAAASALSGAARAQRSAEPATFVLVPGSWTGAWCYRRLADLLMARGHKVYALSLTGLADRSHLASDAVNMDTHVLDVVNFVKWEDLKGIVLVGHSYGGCVITGAAEKIGPEIASIVYLDAFIPEDGQSLEDITKHPLPKTGSVPPFKAKFFQVNAKDAAWFDAKETPQPVNTEREKQSISGAYKKIAKKTYIRTTEHPSPVFQQLYESFKRQPDWKTFLIRSGHFAMIDNPKDLAAMLEQVA